MEQFQEMRMWEVLDGEASEATLAAHAADLAQDQAYAQLFQELSSLHGLLQAMPLEAPSMRFEENVMEAIMAQQALKITADSGVYVFFGLMLVLGSITSIFLWFMPLLPQNYVPNWVQWPQADVSVWVYVGLVANLFLIWVFVDKYYLKPYFDRRFGHI